MTLESITNFGDLAVLLPVIAIAAVGLLIKAGSRYAVVWLAAIGGCAAFTAALKVTLCCGWQPILTSPSGHTAMCTVVYGGLGFLIAAQRRPWQRALTYGLTAIAVGLIAYSRIALQAHTPAEVVAGLMIGAVSLIVMIVLIRRLGFPPQFETGAAVICATAACAAVFMHGEHFITPHVCVCWSAI